MPSFVPNPKELQGATLGSVASNQTVQGQMSGIMDSGNPLLARAKTKAAQAANQRGLLNSSMGVQAGEEAMLTAALPMAQFDATQYSNQAKLNQDWGNKFGLESNAYQYQTGLKEQEYQQQLGTGAYGGTGLIGATTAAQSQLQKEKAAQQLAAQSQAEAHQAGQLATEITSREGISEAELANRLALNAADITSREKLAGNQITHEAAISHAKNTLDAALQAGRIDAQKDLQTKTEAHQTALQTQAESFKESMAKLDFYHKGELISGEAKEKRITIAAELSQRLWNATQLENLSAENKEKLTILDKDMKLAIQGSASASQILTQAMDAIGEVSANKDLSQDSLDKRIGSIISHANANIALIQNWSVTDGGSFVDPSAKR